MTMSKRGCCLYDYLKWDFVALKVDTISTENIVMASIMMLRASYQVLPNMRSYDFYDMTLATK